MINLIKRMPGELYWSSAFGKNDEEIRKLGYSKNFDEYRKSSYKSCGKLSPPLSFRLGDLVDETAFHTYLHPSWYPYADMKRKSHEYFFKSYKLDVLVPSISYKDLYLSILDSIYCSYYPRKRAMDEFGLKRIGNDYIFPRDLLNCPRTKKCAMFWRGIVYKFGDSFREIYNNIQLLMVRDENDLYYTVWNYLRCIDEYFYSKGIRGLELDNVEDYYISSITTLDEGTRKILFNKISSIVRF